MKRNGLTSIKSNLEYSVGIKSEIFIVESEEDLEAPHMIFTAKDKPDLLHELLGSIQPVGILHSPKQRCLEENVCGGAGKAIFPLNKAR